MRYIPQDNAKCPGNPIKEECETCLRKILPIHPETYAQVWQGPWVIEDRPCPRRWVEGEDD